MTDNSYLLQYFLDHSPKETETEKTVAISSKKPAVNKKPKTGGEGHE